MLDWYVEYFIVFVNNVLSVMELLNNTQWVQFGLK